MQLRFRQGSLLISRRVLDRIHGSYLTLNPINHKVASVGPASGLAKLLWGCSVSNRKPAGRHLKSFQGLGFGISGFRVPGFGFQGLGFRGFGFQGLGFRGFGLQGLPGQHVPSVSLQGLTP